MQRIAPLELAENTWDNVGVLVDVPYPRPASKVFLTIDLTPQVLEEALSDPEIGAIISYHPPIFRALKRLTNDDIKQSIVLKAVAKGVGIYSPHTALDNCEDGLNDWLARGLGLGTRVPITPAVNPPKGHENAGSGRIFTYLSPVSLSTVVENIKARLGLEHVRLATAALHSNSSKISTVGICAGSGSTVLGPIKTDVFFTGEMDHHEVLAALAQNTSVILCEHTNTERGYLLAELKPRLETLFDEMCLRSEDGRTVEVVVSKEDQSPLIVV
jgi:dinuclear metal center YbgI/SA1388 family protein